jgi:ABC-type dipeptide/oligopeptide/nickel transport system permease component
MIVGVYLENAIAAMLLAFAIGIVIGHLTAQRRS